MKIVVVRHCKAEGQENFAPLTSEGKQQAKELANFLKNYQFDTIISSPYVRAVESIKPFAELKQRKIRTDHRLSERILSEINDPNWESNLKRTYIEEHLKYPGGESTFEAKVRIQSLLREIESESFQSILVVTHGNLMSLLINLYQPSFGFNEWKLLSNPDVYLIEPLTKAVTKLWAP